MDVEEKFIYEFCFESIINLIVIEWVNIGGKGKD